MRSPASVPSRPALQSGTGASTLQGSAPSEPARACSSRAQSRAVRAIGPMQSRLKPRGTQPSLLTRPKVGLSPLMPQKAAGPGLSHWCRCPGRPGRARPPRRRRCPSWSRRGAGRVPGVARHREAGRGVGPAGGELVQHQLAQEHRAGRPQPADDGRVAPLAPGRVEDAAVGRRRGVAGGDEVLDPERDALQGPPVDAAGEVGVGRARRPPGRLGGDGVEGAERLLRGAGARPGAPRSAPPT